MSKPATTSAGSVLPQLPRGSWDTHFHIFPSDYPLSQTPMFVPPRLDPSAQESLHASLGVDRTVLVHSFAFGDKLESLHDWVAKDPAWRRAVCVLPPTQLDVDADRQFIKRLDGAGVRGVRAELEGDDRATKVRALKKVFERLDRAGVRWTVCVQELDAAFYDALLAAFDSFPTSQILMIDHLAFLPGPWGQHPPPASIDVMAVPHFSSIVALLRHNPSTVYIKLSAPYRLTLSPSTDTVTYDSLEPLVKALKVFPDQLVWGTDWPHTPLHHDMAARRKAGLGSEVIPLRIKEDMPSWLALLKEWLGEEVFVKMMVDNPARLYE